MCAYICSEGANIEFWGGNVILGLNQTPKARYKNKTKFSSSSFHSKGLEKVFSEGKQSRWD